MTSGKGIEPALPRVLDEAAALAQRLVTDGLEAAKREQGNRPEATRKATGVDLVTSVDKAIEAAISDWIQNAFPRHGILGEEGTTVPAAGEWAWRVDPIDGTNNYAYGSPLFGTAVSLHHRDQIVVAAIAHHETVIVAQQGRPLRILESGVSRDVVGGQRGVSPSSALWLGYGVDRVETPLKEILAVINGNTRRNFESWAPTVDTVMYLRGGIDVVIGYRCNGEELRASLFVMASAGAVMKTVTGDDFDPSNPPHLFVAGRPDSVSRMCNDLSTSLGMTALLSRKLRN